MNPSWRKPAGMLLVLALLALWCVVVVSLVDLIGLPPVWTLPIYGLAGFAWLWVFPMRRLLRWMELGQWRN
ncbi:MAG: DUF2842 domain-containing protein [Sphingomonas fennica]